MNKEIPEWVSNTFRKHEIITEDKSIVDYSRYIYYDPDDQRNGITLDSSFNVEELKAIVWWMENIK